ncbi:hypothetical protein [Delftia sp. DT-2]|uniref:hypothetical protein n=1 Tax=Delftia sp. DT-2 TaxID=3022772 RepID=UPI00233F57DA|nr:hypothetical protein [Delftia sp. DT-2]MDC2858642.1 hypothetical protein [Delftia sp. DT-2]
MSSNSIDLWLVDHFRITLFLLRPWEGPVDVAFAGIFSVLPDSVESKPNAGEHACIGNWNAQRVQFRVSLNRLDIIVGAQIPQTAQMVFVERPFDKFAEFVLLVKNWIQGANFEVNRFALATNALWKVEDRARAARKATELAGVTISAPDELEDVQFVYNRPISSSSVPNEKINRVVTASALKVEIGMMIDGAPTPMLSEHYSGLFTDISSRADRGSIIGYEQFLALLDEMVVEQSSIFSRGAYASVFE